MYIYVNVNYYNNEFDMVFLNMNILVNKLYFIIILVINIYIFW